MLKHFFRFTLFLHQDEAFHYKTLLELAKLDFNLMQSLHKEELSNLARLVFKSPTCTWPFLSLSCMLVILMSFRWWKELDFATKLPFAWDRLVECYFCILGVYFEPQCLRGRRILTKVIAMTSILDDIHSRWYPWCIWHT